MQQYLMGNTMQGFQALRLLPFDSVRFQPSLISHVPTQEVLSIKQQGEGWCVSLALASLTGHQGVVAHHYQQHWQMQVRQKNHASFAFITMFHQRIRSMQFHAWLNARPALQVREVSPLAQFFLLLLKPGLSAVELSNVLAQYFQVAVSIQQFAGRRHKLPTREQSCLASAANNQLGKSLILGDKVSYLHAGISLRVGPLSRQQFLRMLPGRAMAKDFSRLVRRAIAPSLSVQCQLVLMRSDLKPLCLNGDKQQLLGLTTWLPSDHDHHDLDDVTFTL